MSIKSEIIDHILKSGNICTTDINTIINAEVESYKREHPFTSILISNDKIKSKKDKYIPLFNRLKATQQFKTACSENDTHSLKNMIMDAIILKKLPPSPEENERVRRIKNPFLQGRGKRSRRHKSSCRKTLKRGIRK